MSALQRNVAALAVAILCTLIAFAAVQIVNAQANAGAGANAECAAKCAADLAKANSTNPPQPQLKCIGEGGAVPETCTYTGPGGVVQGMCLVGNVCQAQTANGKGVDTGLSQLGQILGQLLSKLAQGGGGGGGSGSGSQTTGPTGCTTSYYYTSNTAVIGVDPCALYQPTTNCSDPNATNYGAQATCTYNNANGNGTICLDPNATNFGSNGSCTFNNNNSTTTTNTGADTLNASPQAGPAPLSVTFAITPKSTDTGPFSIDPGDGSGAQTVACAGGSGAGCTYHITYTYTTAGTYTANFLDSNSLTLASATISVTNPNGTVNASNLSSVFGNVGGLSASSSSNGQTSSNFPGVLGNILFNQNGATIFAQTVNSANNSETSGFYGSGTMTSPQGAVGQMCQGRPWASNFLADIIPPSFFDSLCQWGGFQVGQTQTQVQTQTKPQVTLTQQTQTTTNPAKPAATSTTPTVAPQAAIWAVPSSVPLGARTSVYWNTQGVTKCNETSPDGSFNENSLSGAQATVPLTGATTYSISCIDPNGNPITNFVTVTISN